MEENDRIWGKKVVVDSGDSQNLQPGQIVTARKLRDENSMLKRRDLKPVEVRVMLFQDLLRFWQGITRAALGTSFHVCCIIPGNNESLNDIAINGKVDRLEGMKENDLWSFDSCRYRSAWNLERRLLVLEEHDCILLIV